MTASQQMRAAYERKATAHKRLRKLSSAEPSYEGTAEIHDRPISPKYKQPYKRRKKTYYDDKDDDDDDDLSLASRFRARRKREEKISHEDNNDEESDESNDDNVSVESIDGSPWSCSLCAYENYANQLERCALCQTVRERNNNSPDITANSIPTFASSSASIKTDDIIDLVDDEDDVHDSNLTETSADHNNLSHSISPARLSDYLDSHVSNNRSHKGHDRRGSVNPSHSVGVSWLSRHHPKSLSELAVHPKKLLAVQQWIQLNSSSLIDPSLAVNQQTLLILTGPAGCCKSTMIELIAASLGFQLLQWEERADPTSYLPQTAADRNNADFTAESSMSSFRSFLLKAQRYSTLPFKNKETGDAQLSLQKKLIIIEDVPFIGHSHLHSQFVDLIFSLIQKTKYLVILILTDKSEGSSSLEVDRLLDDRILSSSLVSHIQCNAVNDREMIKALKRIIQAEELSLSSAQLSEIVSRSRGDLRHAIQSMHFEFGSIHNYSYHDDADRMKKRHKSRGRKSKDKAAKSRKGQRRQRQNDDIEMASDALSFLSVSRDSSYSLFHSLGKVFYAKEQPESVEEILKKSSYIDPNTILAFLQQNYLNHLNQDEDMSFINQAAEWCSRADILTQATNFKYGDTQGLILADDFPVSLACRGFIQVKQEYQKQLSESSQPNKLSPMRGSDSSKVWPLIQYKKQNVQNLFSNLPWLHSSGCHIWTEVLPFLAILINSESSSLFQSAAFITSHQRRFLKAFTNYSLDRQERSLLDASYLRQSMPQASNDIDSRDSQFSCLQEMTGDKSSEEIEDDIESA